MKLAHTYPTCAKVLNRTEPTSVVCPNFVDWAANDAERRAREQ